LRALLLNRRWALFLFCYAGDDLMIVGPESTMAILEADLLMHNRYKMLSRAHGCNIAALLQGGIFGIS